MSKFLKPIPYGAGERGCPTWGHRIWRGSIVGKPDGLPAVGAAAEVALDEFPDDDFLALEPVRLAGQFLADELEAVDLTLMSVVESPWLYLGLEEEWLDDSKEDEDMPGPEVQWEKEMMREAESAIETARTRLPAGCHASVTPIVERGNPAEFILSEAEKGGYDLVVVGATGAADLKHKMLGKVSTKIAWNAPGSVLVVRSGG